MPRKTKSRTRKKGATKTAAPAARPGREAARIARLEEQLAEAKQKLADIPGELRMLREANKRLRRASAVDGGGKEVMVAATKAALEDWDFVLDMPPPPKRGRRRSKDAVVKALAHVTDTQIGKVTDSYDTGVAEARLMHYARELVGHVKGHHAHQEITDLHVYWGGDMVEGELIFPGQAHMIDSCVFDQACRTAPSILSRMLLYWAQHFPKIKVFAVRGNHGRPASRSAGSSPRTNWDSVCYDVAKLMTEKALLQSGYSLDAVEFHIAETFYIVDPMFPTQRNMITHGDTIRGSLGFPWYGVAKKIAGWIDSVPEAWDNLFIGHFHQYVASDFNGRLWYCGGTPESDNVFARAELAASGRPKQRVMLWTEKYGPVSDLPIYLDDEDDCGGRATVKSRGE